MDRLFDLVIEALWAPATYAKMGVVLAAAPLWWPLAKVMYAEFLPALRNSGEEPKTKLPPGQDPFLSIPLASHRARMGAARAPARARTRRA
ncbi:MAG: hypothetical protein ABL998_03040 [Planctomycetota bacterium]